MITYVKTTKIKYVSFNKTNVGVNAKRFYLLLYSFALRTLSLSPLQTCKSYKLYSNFIMIT